MIKILAKLSLVLTICCSMLTVHCTAQIISTIAGNGKGTYAGDGGQAVAASINLPSSVVIDAVGNLYIADISNYRIRKVTKSTGVISTLAGTGTAGFNGDGGQATAAQFELPYGLTFDALGNLYVSDYNRVRKINSLGIISTIAGGAVGFSGDGGQATSAALNTPWGITFDATGNLYIADWVNQRIRQVNTLGIITTFAGSGATGISSGSYSGDGGQATAATLNSPQGIAFDATGNLYIADGGNNRIRMVNTLGVISTFAGNGTGGPFGNGGQATAAELQGPQGVAFDASGNLYIADYSNNRIQKVNTSGIVNTCAGNWGASYSGDGGLATTASLNGPEGITVDAAGNIYIADRINNRIRFVCTSPDTVSGLITEPNSNPINSGKVYVFRQQPTHAGLLDTAGFAAINANGNYTFPTLPYGNYFIEAKAAATYTNAIGTYYSNKTNNYRWDSAMFISHQACKNSHYTGYNITVIETPTQTGTGIISGNVSGLASYGHRLANGNNSVMGTPVRGIVVKLGKNPAGGCANRTTTDVNGNYIFTNVDIGSYFVFVDIPNFIDTIANVSISSTNPSSTNNNYCVDSVKVHFCKAATGIEELQAVKNELKIYPNPTTGNITIQSAVELGTIYIYNALGETVWHTSSKNNTEQIELGKLPTGIYTLMAKDRYTKLVKE